MNRSQGGGIGRPPLNLSLAEAGEDDQSSEAGSTIQAKFSTWFLQYWYQLKQAVPMLSNIGTPMNPDDGPAYLFSTMFSRHLLATDFAARFALVPWMTYRKDFAPIEGYQTDCGWGCMLRSAQMMLAETLFRTECALGSSVASRVTREKVLRLFADQPNRPYSLHEMSRRASKYGKRAGQWFEPTLTLLIVCEMLKDREQVDKVRAIVARDGLLDASSLVPLSSSDAKASPIPMTSKTLSTKVAEFDPLLNPKLEPTFIPTLLLVPLRLGLRELNEESYGQAIIEALRFPQSVGMIGGKPGHSLYFCGSQSSGRLVFLDPHTVQSALQCSDLSTYQCPSARSMPLREVDPSLALGFLVSTYDDFVDLKARVEALPGPVMFSISTNPVDYSASLDDDYEGDDGNNDDDNEEDEEFEQVRVPPSPLVISPKMPVATACASSYPPPPSLTMATAMESSGEEIVVDEEGEGEIVDDESFTKVPEVSSPVAESQVPPLPSNVATMDQQKKDTFVFL